MGKSMGTSTTGIGLVSPASDIAKRLFQSLLQLDMAAQGVSAAQWDALFEALAKRSSSPEKVCITRKEWSQVTGGGTELFDAIQKRYSASMSKEEWRQGLPMFSGSWRKHRKVMQCSVMDCWGVSVGSDFYEILTRRSMEDVERSDLLNDSAFDRRACRLEASERLWDCLQMTEVVDFDRNIHVGWTVKTDEQIEDWLRDGWWWTKNTVISAQDEIDFANDFARWLVSSNERIYWLPDGGRSADVRVFGDGKMTLCSEGDTVAIVKSRCAEARAPLRWAFEDIDEDSEAEEEELKGPRLARQHSAF